MALCLHLAFWTGGDVTWMDDLFRQSGLMREKWDEVHTADGRTYGELTLGKAVAMVDEFYDPSQYDDEEEARAAPAIEPASGDSAPAAGRADEATATAVGSGTGWSRAHLEEAKRVLEDQVAAQDERIAEQRETIQAQAERIDELEAEIARLREILAERETTIEELQASLEAARTPAWHRLPAWLTGRHRD